MKLVRLLLSLLFLVLLARGASAASADDTARFLAGMKVPANSPLAEFADEPGWQQHANAFNAAFKRVEARQLTKIHAWAKANLTVHRPTLYYTFSGPDFLYAGAFFPDAQTYVLAGLEPVGPIPDMTALSKPAAANILKTLRTSLRSVLDYSFFRTKDMENDLGAKTGTLPILYVFLARSGKVISDVSLMKIGPGGNPPAGKGGSSGAKIVFSSPGGKPQTLYYFSTNLQNDGFKRGGFPEFCAKFGEGVSFVKSASYLMHDGSFSLVRSFLLKNSAAILQDDSGIPLSKFDAQWELKTYGYYRGPIGLFSSNGQPKLAQLFQEQERRPLGFGIGYRWQPNESNLLLAVKRNAPTEPETEKPPPGAENGKPPAEGGKGKPPPEPEK